MAPETTAMFVKGVPQDLKQRLIDRRSDELRSLNDVIVALLADHYGIEYEPARYAGNVEPDPAIPNVEVRLPVPLYRRIVRDVLDKRLKGQRVRQGDHVISILSDQLAAAA